MKRFCFFFVLFCCMFGLVRAHEKQEFSPGQMTPLVGKGCVINQIDKSLVELFGNVSALNNVIDTNTDNYTSFSSLAGIDAAYHQILSIKDVDRVFPADVEAGFVMQSTSGGTNLLTVDVLELFVVETYLNGEKQESSVNQETGGGLLNLNLITIAKDGKSKVSIRTTKPFDEVRLAITGVSVDAFSNLKLYYAYVGENPIIPITQPRYNASVHGHSVAGIGSEWTTAIWNWPNQKEKLVGEGSENDGVGFGTLSSLLTEPRVTIDAGEVIPANTEIGFVIESGSILAIDILKNTVLTTYDADDNEVESKTIASVIGLSAISGGRTTVSMITTKPCQQIKIKFGGLNIDVGGTKIFYAYTRSTELYVEPECDLKLSADITVCGDASAQLSGVDGIIWTIDSQPEGANATVSSSGLVSNMTVAGDYVIKAQKGDCVDYVVVTSSPSSGISYECNRPIVGLDMVAPFSPKGGGCLLCLSPDLDEGANNVVDEDLTNYIEYTKGLDLLSNTSIYGVQRVDGGIYEASETAPRRVGFIMQATDQFLTADVLKFFVIKTYLGDELQESSPIDENDAIAANLIGGNGNQMRYSFVATKNFDRIALWTAGILSLNLSKFRIYYAFEEPANSNCMSQYTSSACLSLLSAQTHGASINYERTGFNGVANVGASMTNLANILDGDMNTYAFINKTAGIAATTTLSVKANQVFEHGYQAGFVVEEQTWLGNVDLLRALRIKTYLNGVETGDEAIQPEVLSLDLIGSTGKSLIAITPTKPFDELVLDMGGLVDALVELKVYGAFVQPDTDGDGTPDCMDKNPCGEDLVVADVKSGCIGDPVSVRIEGGKAGAAYALWNGIKEYPFDTEGIASYVAETAGKFSLSIRENGFTVYDNIPVMVHPLETQWTGAISTDWNDWDNWTNGVPAKCTNVIIPSVSELAAGEIRYPILKEGLQYACNGMHIKPGAVVVRQDLLDYENTWISVNMTPEKNYMLSIPLTDTYSGDFYIPTGTAVAGKDLRNPFTEEISGNVNRINPFTYCRVWNGEWTNVSDADLLKRLFKVGEPIVINARKGTSIVEDTQLEMLFGKTDTTYIVYNSFGMQNGAKVSIERTVPGQFIFPHTKGKALKPFSATLAIKDPQDLFAVANPFISYLDVDAFMAANPSLLGIWVNDDITKNPNSDFASCKQLSSSDKVAPYTSFFVKVPTATTSLVVTFNKDMMVHGDYATAKQSASQTKSKASGSTGINLSNIKAYAKDGEAVISASETIKSVQIVTAAGQVLASKQPNSMEVRMPLGQGVNIVKIQTENNVQIIKLINN